MKRIPALFLLSLAVMVAAPAVLSRQSVVAAAPNPPLVRPAVFVRAASSTYLLPRELSAERVRWNQRNPRPLALYC